MNNEIPADLASQLLEQAQILDQVMCFLQQVQDTLPTPSQEEVSLLREGGTLSVAAHLCGLLQRVILGVENAASDLRTGIEQETLWILDQIHPSAVEINAIDAVLRERLQRNA